MNRPAALRQCNFLSVRAGILVVVAAFVSMGSYKLGLPMEKLILPSPTPTQVEAFRRLCEENLGEPVSHDDASDVCTRLFQLCYIGLYLGPKRHREGRKGQAPAGCTDPTQPPRT